MVEDGISVRCIFSAAEHIWDERNDTGHRRLRDRLLSHVSYDGR
jgi:hypothetical protein